MSAAEASTIPASGGVTGFHRINRAYQDEYDRSLEQLQDLPKPHPDAFDHKSTPATQYPDVDLAITQYQTIERVFQTEMDPSLMQNQDPPKPDPASFDMHSTPAMQISAPEILPPIISETA